MKLLRWTSRDLEILPGGYRKKTTSYLLKNERKFLGKGLGVFPKPFVIPQQRPNDTHQPC